MASHLAGLDSIPAIITEADADQVLEPQLAENIQRENLDLAELAAAVRRLFGKHTDLGKVADIVKKSKPWVSKHLALSYPEFSNTAKHLLMSGATHDLEQLHRQPDPPSCTSNCRPGRPHQGRHGRPQGSPRAACQGAKEKKDANKAAAAATKRATTPAAPQPVDQVEKLVNAAHSLTDGTVEVDEVLATFPTDTLAEIDPALPSHWLADSHAKGALFKDKVPAAMLRGLAAEQLSYIRKAAFIVGALGLQLTVRNYLVEAREISRLMGAE